jgi:tetratricopeptide (TPR) repeat protein
VRQAREAAARERHAVEATLDLGMLVLLKAQKLADDRRGEALGKAEKLFLAVRGAGPAEEVDLNLAEVYYWLGKQAEGKKLFDGLLQARARAPRLLLRVGAALRRVGEVSEARRLAEEAYKRGPTPRDREDAADFRALLWTDLDDRITWLRRVNPSAPGVKADLSLALGQKAAREGKDDEAIQHLREAVAEYDRLPLNAGTLNNQALAHTQLYRLSGNREDFARASRMMDNALAQMPGDSILLRNAASLALEAVMQDVLGKAVDLKVLKGYAGLHLLRYLCADRAGRDALAARVREHPVLARLIQHYERVLILSPRDPIAPSILSGIYATTQDMAALRRLEGQMRKASLDLEHSTKEILDSYGGKNLEKQRTEHAARVAQRRKTLEAARKVGGTTHAVAAGELVLELSRADSLDLPVDADELVRLAEEAHKAAPSRGTRDSLVSALLVRAGRAVAAQDKGYADWAARGRRALGSGSLIALALTDGGWLRDVLLKNADVGRVMDLEREEARAFPDETNPWAWALLQAAHPEDAARLAKAADTDETGRLLRALGNKLAPVRAQAAVTDSWTLRMTGHEAEAREVLRRAAARRIPLPLDVK